MKSKTYDEWRELGYHVIKGEKSTGRNKEDVCTFTREQVEDDDSPTVEDEIFDSHEFEAEE